MTDQIRAVMVGCGSMSAAWLNAARELGNVAIAGFVDINGEAAAKRRAEYGTPASVAGTNLQAVLGSVKADVVFDCTVPAAHYQTTLTALRNGCHVLGEKPLADTMARAREMVEAAQAAGKVYAVVQNRRYDPVLRRLRDLAHSGAIGEVTTVNSDFYLGPHFGGFRDQMKHVLLLDMAIHSFDQARFLSGTDAVRVFCKEWNPSGSWYAQDASAVCVFTMTNGVVYTYRGSWCAEGLNTSWQCEWRVLGSKGSAVWDGAETVRAAVAVGGEGFTLATEDLLLPPEREPLKGEGHKSIMREFVQAIRTGARPETAASDNIKSLAMVFGAIRSAETGQEVEIAAV